MTATNGDMAKMTKRNKTAIHIDEDHNESLGRILGAAGSKRIPISGNVLVHFDSHPDLLIPKNLTAEECRDRLIISLHSVSITSCLCSDLSSK